MTIPVPNGLVTPTSTDSLSAKNPAEIAYGTMKKYETTAPANQAAGRCVRTPISKGVTVITDSNFWSLFEHTSRASFPGWFREAVSWYHPAKEKV